MRCQLMPFCLLVVSIRQTLSQRDITSEGQATQHSDYGHRWGSSSHAHHATAALNGESHEWREPYYYTWNSWSRSYSCSATALYQTTAWWKISFKDLKFITNVKIYYRENSGYRLAGFSVYVTNNTSEDTSPPTGHLCYRHTGPDLPDVFQNISCHYLGKNVVLYNNRTEKAPSTYSQYAILELCGVRVFACPKGVYGKYCNEPCPKNCLDRHCFPENGECVWGCHWKNCNKEICNKKNGNCLEGCIKGVTGDFCTGNLKPDLPTTTTHINMWTQPKDSNPQDPDNYFPTTAVVVGSAVAITTVIIIIIIVLIVLKRRRTENGDQRGCRIKTKDIESTSKNVNMCYNNLRSREKDDNAPPIELSKDCNHKCITNNSVC